MEAVVTLYDDLVAIRRAAQVLPESTSQETRDDLGAVLARIQGKLKEALKALSEGEREDVLYDLSECYGEDVRRDLAI